ncbi:hypothetical protein [Leptospira alexanderi]|uniref:hypothetical protein n=1 Tax=Leptospira alexanderi TaxID=100053 RepID=UPI000990C881|nr:hypothetical protein [Leptospira alexanderi]
MNKRIEVQVVGFAGDTVLYIQFFLDGIFIPGQLWKLQYPGNRFVEALTERVVQGKDGETQIKLSLRTREFFSVCVFGVNDPVTDTERDLVEKFGKNPCRKTDVDAVPPALFYHWNRVISRFFDGDLFAEVLQLGETSDDGGAASGSVAEG